MQKIHTFLWYDHQAEEAANFYVSVFADRTGSAGESRILEASRYGEGAPLPAGSVMTISFLLEGQRFTALNGGPGHDFTDAISLYVDCETQDEVDDLWTKLTADGGRPGPCGWLVDRYGLSWQIIPTALGALLGDPDPGRAQRAMQAMLQMTRIDVEGMRRAADAA
jgi:predicted 3-demethylubiquinone-9 3-methyltransferase (glyoxalase superfamily)